MHELTTAAVKAWQSITREETKHLLMSVGSRLFRKSLSAKDLQTAIKPDYFIYDCVVLSKYFSTPKIEGLCLKIIVIPIQNCVTI